MSEKLMKKTGRSLCIVNKIVLKIAAIICLLTAFCSINGCKKEDKNAFLFEGIGYIAVPPDWIITKNGNSYRINNEKMELIAFSIDETTKKDESPYDYVFNGTDSEFGDYTILDVVKKEMSSSSNGAYYGVFLVKSRDGKTEIPFLELSDEGEYDEHNVTFLFCGNQIPDTVITKMAESFERIDNR